MTEKGKKQKTIVQQFFLFEEGKDLLFFSYDPHHPKRIDIEEFYIGKVKLFRKDGVYSAELRSKPYLNPLLIWNSETFQLMVNRMKYFVIEKESIDFSQSLFLSVYVKVKGRQINLLKIKLNEEFGIDPQSELWNEFKKFNSFKAKFFAKGQQTIQNLSVQIQQSLDRLEKVQFEQNQKVDQIKRKLSAILSQKQKKIRQLSGNHLYEWTNQEQQKIKKQQNNPNQNFQQSISNWISSQEDRVLVGSLFAPSQNYPF